MIPLSVIIPTYDRSAFVRGCVASVRGCGVAGVEIIVVDDGSTDDTAQVVAALEGVVYLSQQNAGPAAARNLGFGHSRGRYVAFLDCDDLWLPGVAEQIVGLLDRNQDVDVIFSDAKMGNEKEGYRSFVEMGGQAAFFELPYHEPEPKLRVLEPPGTRREQRHVPFFRRLAVRNPVFIGATIMRREAFARAGMFDPELCGAADWELWLRMASQMTFGYWPEPLAIYTRHGDCMSNDHDVMGRDFCLALKKVLEKCVSLDDEERWFIEERLRSHLFGHGYRAYDRADYGEARRRFAAVLTECGWEFRSAGYWCLCALPFRAAGLLRRVKHVLAP